VRRQSRARDRTGREYYDATNRHGLLAWILIQHTRRGKRLAVDLPTVEVFNSMTMADGQESMTFGRIVQVIQANPVAPADFVLR
jgi:hypothetical protein